MYLQPKPQNTLRDTSPRNTMITIHKKQENKAKGASTHRNRAELDPKPLDIRFITHNIQAHSIVQQNKELKIWVKMRDYKHNKAGFKK